MVLKPAAPALATPPLSVTALVTSISEALNCLPDHRKGGNNQKYAHGGAFLFVCLPPSHALLYEWVADFERTGEVPTLVKTRWTGTPRLTDTDRWLNELPLRDGEDALTVGWCERTTTNAAGEVLYRNA